MMFRCFNCGKQFDEPKELQTTYESYYGVSDNFGNSTIITLKVCPHCECDIIDEMEEAVEDED